MIASTRLYISALKSKGFLYLRIAYTFSTSSVFMVLSGLAAVSPGGLASGCCCGLGKWCGGIAAADG